MNENHRCLCPSAEWAAHLHEEILPALAPHVEGRREMLELGPGPGAATEWLRHRVERLVAVELDEDAARALGERFAGTNVEAVRGDATSLQVADASFDVVGTFTMLHHVPTLEAQRAIVAEALRVLRPGGALVGSDSLASVGLHAFHEGDTYNPIDPAVLLVLLRTLGFERLCIVVGDSLLFVAHKPDPTSDAAGACEQEGEPR